MRYSCHRRLAAISLAIALSMLGAPAIAGDRAGDIPAYRGDAARTGMMPGPGPSGTPEVVWSFQSGAPIASQVAVVGDAVFLVTVTGSVHALEITTGTELWRADLGVPSKGGPSVSDGLVIVVSGDGVVALDSRDGSIAWSSTATGPVSGTPAVVDDMVFAASEDGMASALEIGTGDTVWQVDLGIATANSVAADPSVGIAVLGGREGVAVAVELDSGRVRWRYDTDDSARIGTPTIGNGLVYLATLEGGGPGTRHIHALDAVTGERAWVMDSPGDAPAFAPALFRRRAFISSEDGSVTAVDARSGALLWRYGASGVVETVAAVADDTVYIATNDGQALALDAATGTERWHVPIEGIPYGVAVTGGLVLVGTTAGMLYAIGDRSA